MTHSMDNLGENIKATIQNVFGMTPSTPINIEQLKHELALIQGSRPYGNGEKPIIIENFKNEKISQARWDYGTLGLTYCKRKFDETPSKSEKARYFLGAVASGIGVLSLFATGLGPVALALPIFAGVLGTRAGKERFEKNPPDDAAIREFAVKSTLNKLNKDLRKKNPKRQQNDLTLLLQELTRCKTALMENYPNIINSKSYKRLEENIERLNKELQELSLELSKVDTTKKKSKKVGEGDL